MAKEIKKQQPAAKPNTAKVKAEDAKAKAATAPAPIKVVKPDTLGTGAVALVPFKANQVEKFGNNFMIALIAQAGLEEEASKQMAAAGEAKAFLSFEITKAIFSIAHKTKGTKSEVDIYGIFGSIKDVERLNNRILVEMGVKKKIVDDETDEVKYIWTDDSVKASYDVSVELKEKDEPEYIRRNNNKKRLNARLSDACKAAATLMDHGLSPDDLFYSEDQTTGGYVPTIKNAPKQIGGEAGMVQMNSRKPVKGATLSPTMSSLVKISTDRHKEPTGDRKDKGENREEEKMGMTDEAFGSIINSTRRAITKQENQFTAEMQKHIKGLSDLLNETMKTWLLKKEPETVKEADKKAAENAVA